MSWQLGLPPSDERVKGDGIRSCLPPVLTERGATAIARNGQFSDDTAAVDKILNAR